MSKKSMITIVIAVLVLLMFAVGSLLTLDTTPMAGPPSHIESQELIEAQKAIEGLSCDQICVLGCADIPEEERPRCLAECANFCAESF